MTKQPLDDVQRAIDSQTIQTVLEQNNSGLTNVALQSFLTNAPIPRAWFYDTTVTTINTGTEPPLTWTAATMGLSYDPYKMYIGGGGFRLPIDGFYTLTFTVGIPTNGVASQYWASIKMLVGSYGAGGYLAIQSTYATAGNNWMTCTCTKPFRAGDTFATYVFNGSATNQNIVTLATAAPTLSIVWNSPLNTYTTQGGN